MYLVRKITRTKWDSANELEAGEIPADAVTSDLRTTANSLSLWTASGAGDDELNEAILALVAGAERIDKVDVVWMERARFEDAGIGLATTDGRTPVADLVELHVDALRLDLVRLARFAEEVAHALKVEQHKRLTKKSVAQLIAAAVEAGRVAHTALTANVWEEVSKHVKQVQ